MAGLSIAPPYTLDPLDSATASTFETQMKTSLGAMGSLVNVGARMAKRNGLPAAVIIGMSFNGVPTDSPTFLDSVAGGAAGSAAGAVTTRTIEGRAVKVVEGTSGTFAMYQHGSTIVMAIGTAKDEAVPVITAVIQASE